MNHGQHRDKHPDSECHSKHSHDRSDTAHDQASQVVFNRYHRLPYSPRLLTASAIARREAFHAGTSVLAKATASEIPAASSTVSQVTLNVSMKPVVIALISTPA